MKAEIKGQNGSRRGRRGGWKKMKGRRSEDVGLRECVRGWRRGDVQAESTQVNAYSGKTQIIYQDKFYQTASRKP